jgi:hypothetical protein
MTTSRPAPAARTFSFGGEDRYVGTITDARGPAKPFGAIIWGMGIGEMRVARALTKVGVTVMNIKREKYSLPELDAYGAERGREAMDVLRVKRGIERFIFMGNCSFASISFNTALRDERVIGLIMSNPHVSEMLSLPSSYRRKLLSVASWRQVLAGKFTLARHLVNARRLKDIVVGRMKGLDEKSLIAKTHYNRDLTLPDDIGAKLAAFGARGMHTLLVFSHNDGSLDYFRAAFGRALDGLGNVAGLTTEVLQTDAHLVTIDEEAARLISASAAGWIERADWSAAGRPRRQASVIRGPAASWRLDEAVTRAPYPAG